MGMALSLVTLGDAGIRRILEDPPLVWKVIAPDDPEVYESARPTARMPGLLARLLGRTAPRRADPPPLELSPDEGIAKDLDKAWHGIHYLLTGTAWEGEFPTGFLVAGGRDVGTIDVGYGRARVFDASETREIHATLAALDDDELRRRFDPQDMTAKDIYPSIWDRDPKDDDTLGYLMEYVAVLRRFLSGAVEKGLGIVVFVS